MPINTNTNPNEYPLGDKPSDLPEEDRLRRERRDRHEENIALGLRLMAQSQPATRVDLDRAVQELIAAIRGEGSPQPPKVQGKTGGPAADGRTMVPLPPETTRRVMTLYFGGKPAVTVHLDAMVSGDYPTALADARDIMAAVMATTKEWGMPRHLSLDHIRERVVERTTYPVAEG